VVFLRWASVVVSVSNGLVESQTRRVADSWCVVLFTYLHIYIGAIMKKFRLLFVLALSLVALPVEAMRSENPPIDLSVVSDLSSAVPFEDAPVAEAPVVVDVVVEEIVPATFSTEMLLADLDILLLKAFGSAGVTDFLLNGELYSACSTEDASSVLRLAVFQKLTAEYTELLDAFEAASKRAEDGEDYSSELAKVDVLLRGEGETFGVLESALKDSYALLGGDMSKGILEVLIDSEHFSNGLIVRVIKTSAGLFVQACAEDFENCCVNVYQRHVAPVLAQADFYFDKAAGFCVVTVPSLVNAKMPYANKVFSCLHADKDVGEGCWSRFKSDEDYRRVKCKYCLMGTAGAAAVGACYYCGCAKCCCSTFCGALGCVRSAVSWCCGRRPVSCECECQMPECPPYQVLDTDAVADACANACASAAGQFGEQVLAQGLDAAMEALANGVCDGTAFADLPSDVAIVALQTCARLSESFGGACVPLALNTSTAGF